ncbi:MAG: OmpH family outer membrane protein [Flavobacteriaceae bacterium]|jgi:outer membrane protein|nr:OmpH family outer membrane protein [Flavobacteriaceae bacterium]
MKKMKSLFVAIMLFIGATSFVNAQSKIAHIDTQALAEAMPEMKAAQSQLEKLQRTYDTEIKTLSKEFETKLKQYEVEAESKTAEVNAKRAEEVQGMQANINAYRQGALEDLQKKQEDLIAPILEKARTAIQKVGRSQGYQYVLDSSSLLLAEGKDLLVDVKKELGI